MQQLSNLACLSGCLLNWSGLLLQLSPSDVDVVEQYKSALNDAKTYVRRTIVVTLGDQARARDDKQQEKEEQEKSVMVGHSSFEVSFM